MTRLTMVYWKALKLINKSGGPLDAPLASGNKEEHKCDTSRELGFGMRFFQILHLLHSRPVLSFPLSSGESAEPRDLLGNQVCGNS